MDDTQLLVHHPAKHLGEPVRNRRENPEGAAAEEDKLGRDLEHLEFAESRVKYLRSLREAFAFGTTEREALIFISTGRLPESELTGISRSKSPKPIEASLITSPLQITFSDWPRKRGVNSGKLPWIRMAPFPGGSMYFTSTLAHPSEYQP